MPVLQLLKNIDFLAGVPEENLQGILFTMQKQKFGPNKTVLFQGEIANRLFIIREGDISITTKNKGTKIHLADLKAPMYFGEISLLRPTSATATAVTGPEGADMLILTHDSMASLSKKVPDIEQRIQKVIDERIANKKAARDQDDNN